MIGIFGIFAHHFFAKSPNSTSTPMESIVDISHLAGMKKFVTEYSSLQSDYVFSHITNGSDAALFRTEPTRINGLVFCFVAKGFLDLEFNLEKYHVSENTIFIADSTATMSLKDYDHKEIDVFLLVLSHQFADDINIDLNVMRSSRLSIRHEPTFVLTPEESRLLLHYLLLLHHNTIDNHDDIYIRSISRNLIAAIIYQLMQFATKRDEYRTDERPMNRRSGYVHDFMKLVHAHHKKHRSVSFYAEQLFITPKYLSLIVKEATGSSAAEWIDRYVILEAKNMLRFSHKNIQQIAYELNFSNQSSFGKYFKNLTGMSPSAFQRS